MVDCFRVNPQTAFDAWQNGGEEIWTFDPEVEPGRLNNLTLRFEPLALKSTKVLKRLSWSRPHRPRR